MHGLQINYCTSFNSIKIFFEKNITNFYLPDALGDIINNYKYT